ncbi:hypothetical protein LTR17_012418 [Elasticomyces elasticus]|nr:hypothetical protein LTR17_012418 [Elasticomyces elasticus]
MAVNRLIDAIRMRERSVAPEDDLVSHTFKITPTEYRDQLPDLVTANSLNDFYHNHTFHEYIELTQRYTLLPSITSIVHEGIASGINSQFTVALHHIQTATKSNPNLDPEQRSIALKKSKSIRSKGRGCGQIMVEGCQIRPNLVWQFGSFLESADVTFPAILYIINPTDIDVDDLLKEMDASQPPVSTMIVVLIQSLPPQTGIRDMRASIDIYARDGQGSIKRVDTGGLFRDRDGAMLPCEVELTVNHFLPAYERDEFTAGQSIKFDVSEIAEALASDERADTNITNKRRLYDISPSYFDGLGDGNE